jgi:hypothetical protein
MATISKLEHAILDEEQCDFLIDGARGRCPHKIVEGSNRCAMHNGTQDANIVQKNNIRAYQLAKWKTKIDRFYDNPNIKTLREEIALARMTLEAVIGRCDDEADLFIHSGKIQTLLMQIEKLVTACNKLESNLGLVLDKSAAINLAEELVQTIQEHVEPDVMLIVSEKIIQSITVAGRSTVLTGSDGK